MNLVKFDLTQKAEAELVVKIVKEFYTATAFPPSVEKVMNGDIHYFKAYDGELFVGISGFYLKTPALAETVKTIVFSEYRGKGYGESISLLIENECKKLNVKKVMTTIYTGNVAMIAIKLKQGYTIEGYHPEHEAPGFDEYSLGKLIR